MLKIDIKKTDLDLSIKIPCPACKRDFQLTNKNGDALKPVECPHCKAPFTWE